MKVKFIFPLFFLLICASCSPNSDSSITDEESIEVEIYQWHLTNVSGGVAGVDIDFEADTVVYVFNVDFNGNGSLSVENNNNNHSLEDGLDTGVYPVSIPVYDSNSILFIDGSEYGAVVTPSAEDLILNQNITSVGTQSDGFVYTFKRKIIIQII